MSHFCSVHFQLANRDALSSTIEPRKITSSRYQDEKLQRIHAIGAPGTSSRRTGLKRCRRQDSAAAQGAQFDAQNKK